jgi:hypothetical protein
LTRRAASDTLGNCLSASATPLGVLAPNGLEGMTDEE